jgi:hypothetical protein
MQNKLKIKIKRQNSMKSKKYYYKIILFKFNLNSINKELLIIEKLPKI